MADISCHGARLDRQVLPRGLPRHSRLRAGRHAAACFAVNLALVAGFFWPFIAKHF